MTDSKLYSQTEFKKSSCQLMAKKFALSTCTDKLPPGGLSKISVVRITDRPDMTSSVYRGCKATNKSINF